MSRVSGLTAAVAARASAPVVEQCLLEVAAEQGSAAAVWEPPQGLVVPPSYRRHEGFDALCAVFEAEGWPVSVRRSGGGLVPQGAGMLTLSLAWRTRLDLGRGMEPVYQGLCSLVQRVLAPFTVDTNCAAVEGSFCDGRFNLARGGRKVAGTAQYWKRLGADEHLVLAHACLLVEADLPALNARANDFEVRLGTGQCYRAEVLANLVDAQAPPRDAQGRWLDTARLRELLDEATRGGLALC